MTIYIDSRNEDITPAEAIALCTKAAKPYPESWYKSGYELLESRNDSLDQDIEEAQAIAKSDIRFSVVRSRGGVATASYRNLRDRWAQFSCPLNRWEALYCNI